MSPLYRSTPARLTAPATTKLPRLALYALLLAYIVAGLFMRDPWKSDDLIGMATMLDNAREGGQAWLLPRIGDMAHAQNGPLSAWAGGLFAVLFGGWLGEVTAARLPNILWFLLCAAGLWYGAYLIGRRPEAQPLALPFGGEPNERDYGRMIADAALLLLLATAGILIHVHETGIVPALLACNALAFYGLTRMLDKPLNGAIFLGLGLAGACLARGLPGVLPLLLALPFVFRPGCLLWHRLKWLALGLAIAALPVIAWLLAASAQGARGEYWIDSWLQWNLDYYGLPTFKGSIGGLRDLSWFLWPTWPLAALAISRWRGWYNAPHIAIALGLLAAGLLSLLVVPTPGELDFIALVVPAAALAALSLPTLRRGIVNTLDWFAVMCFSLTAVTVWLGWIALHLGWPPKIAHNIARQTTGFDPSMDWLPTLLAILISLGWVALLRWRFKARPTALWRGTILSAGGLATTWLLLVLLWLPAIDYARSYRAVSAELAQTAAREIGPGECIRAVNLGTSQRAAFYVFDKQSFSYDSRCNFVLVQTSRSAMEEGRAPHADAQHVLWEGARAADRHELFRLLRLR